MNWTHKHFDQLSLSELYQLLQLRAEVFVVEQNCPFNDLDGKDQHCYHLMCHQHDQLLAYTRIVPAGISYQEVSIGRVLTSPLARKNGLGKELMRRSIDLCYGKYGKQNIKIGAQLYLKNFYESLGFEQTSEIYLEDNIEHILMILLAK